MDERGANDNEQQLRELAEKQRAYRKQLDELQQLGAKIEADIRLLKNASRPNTIQEKPSSNTTLSRVLKEQKARVEKVPKPETAPPPLPQAPNLAALAKAEDKPVSNSSEVKTPTPTSTGETTDVNAVGEWEMQLGRVWLVRIGVLMLLTGLVFLSTYAYKNWLFNAGAGVKVSFFMGISLTLTGVGLWLERKKERFLQYGRVLASGGLAAGYYTVYASHFTPSLRIIDSAVLAGVCLTAWAGLILGFAVWKKSRVVAIMAIGLAFYGTVVNPSGWLSLFSALLLASAGMVLLIRFRWMAVGIGTMVAAYLAHAFWIGFYPQTVTESVRLGYLASYWLLFTTVLAVPQSRELGKKCLRAFASINNGAAWCLTVFIVPAMLPHAQIGWISLGVGLLWIGISAAARYGKLLPRWLAPVFGYQGLLVMSLGIMIESTGYTRFLVLAVEACVLLAGARYFGGLLARCFSVLTLLASLAFAVQAGVTDMPAWPSYAALALSLIGYTALVRKDQGTTEEDANIAALPAALTWIVLTMGVFFQWSPAAGVIGLSILTTATMLSYFLIKKPWWLIDLAMVAVPMGIFVSVRYIADAQHLSFLQTVIPLVCTAVFWWKVPAILGAWSNLTSNQTKLTEPDKSPTSHGLDWIWAIAFWAVVTRATNVHLPMANGWLFLGGLYAIGGHFISEFTGRKSMGTVSTLLHLAGISALILELAETPILAWVPVFLLLVHLCLVDVVWSLLDRKIMRRVLSTALTLCILARAFQSSDRPEVLIMIYGVILLVWAQRKQCHAIALISGVIPLIVACITAIVEYPPDDWRRYFPILAAGGTHAWLWLSKRDDKHLTPHRVLLLTTTVTSLVIVSSMHVLTVFDGSGLAICWALFASVLFAIGLLMRYRPYRLLGLAWLAASMLHVICIDVMRLETLGRILSFITLGIVLLGLGFLYNRFQETIRKFL